MANYKGKFTDIGQGLYTLEVKERSGLRMLIYLGRRKEHRRKGYNGPFSIWITNKNTGYYPFNYTV